MIRFTLRGLLTRKLRSSLTAVAIVLGVCMISGTYVLTDTINHSFDSLYQQIYKGTDAYITGKSVVKSQYSGTGITPSFPQSMLTEVRSVSDVKSASGGVGSESCSVVGKNGKIISTGGAPNLGYSIDPSIPELSTVTLVSGAWPKKNEVVIDKTTADKAGYKTGDMIGILVNGPVHKMRLSGIIKFGSSNGIMGATLAGFDLATAQQLFDRRGKLDSIQAVAKPGVSPNRLVKELRSALPKSMTIRTGQQEASKATSDTSKQISAIQYFLLAFAGIALFVGSFVIINTLSITVAQRTREFATLRTLGGSRIQVLGSIIIEALIIGVLASVSGLLLGFGLAAGLIALFRRLGLELPQNAFVIEPRTIYVALAVGIIVTLIASIRPALRATRVPPIAAVREGATLPESRFHRFRTAGALLLTAFGFLLLMLGLFGKGMTTAQILTTLGGGAVLIFIGVALVAARVIRPIAAAVSPLGTAAVAFLSVLIWPVTYMIWMIRRAKGRSPEFPTVAPDRTMNNLALANSGRSPERTASSAAALMIGLALVTLVAVIASSIIGSFKGAVDSIFTGDYAVMPVNSNSTNGTPIAAADAVAKVKGVESTSSVRFGFGLVYGKSTMVTALDGQPSEVFRLTWKTGSESTLNSLGSTGAIVSDAFATQHHLNVQSAVRVVTPAGKSLDLHVTGIFRPPTGGSPFGDVTFSAKTFDANFQDPSNMYTLLKMRGGESGANSKALDKALAGFPNAQAQTRKEFVDSQIAQLNPILMMLYVLLAFSILISFVGIVVMLVLTIYERTRELGMLRAIGITQRQTRRMIRHESVITALIGGALGIVLGLVFGVLLVHRMPYVSFSLPSSIPYVPFSFPGLELIFFAFAAVVVGIVAAVFPARRAAKLNVLEALQYE
jgi:putative ABC transport system permease protein